MIPDIWVYRTSDRLITKHGKRALRATDRLVIAALDRRDPDRVLLMLRVPLAVQLLQAAPSACCASTAQSAIARQKRASPISIVTRRS